MSLQAITVSEPQMLSAELGLLSAPILVEGPAESPVLEDAWPRVSTPQPATESRPEMAGHVIGAVVDDASESIQHLMVELDDGGWVLVPPSVVRTERIDDSTFVCHVPWTRAELEAQPRVAKDATPLRALTSDYTGVPPNPNSIGDLHASFKEGFVGAAIGGAAGLVTGAAMGEPIIAATLAVFLGVGGGIAGMMSGAGREPSADAARHEMESDVTIDRRLMRLGPRLVDAVRVDNGALHIEPVTAAAIEDPTGPRGPEGDVTPV